MKRILSGIMAAVSAVAAARAGDGCAVVSGDRIHMKDLARLRPVFGQADPEAFLGFAPAPGVRRVFTSGQLKRLMQAHGLAGKTPAPVCFERAARRRTAEEVAEAARRAWGDREVRVEVVDYQRTPAPEGRLEFPRNRLAVAAGAGPETEILWRGRVVYGRGRSAPFWARVRLAERRRLVVARRELKPGEEVKAASVAVREVEVAPTAPEGFRRREAVLGARVRRRIAAGEPVFADAVAIPAAVSRGDLVRVEVLSGGTRLAFEARAENSARKGELVRLRSPLNEKAHLTATVTGVGRAVIHAGGDLEKDR